MRNGVFERSDTLRYARASTVMSTHSATGFEWSVKVIGSYFGIGIASKLDPGSIISINDQEAILLDADNSDANLDIKRGLEKIHFGLKKLQTGDVVYFKFQPSTKTFIIEWVSNFNSS